MLPKKILAAQTDAAEINYTNCEWCGITLLCDRGAGS